MPILLKEVIETFDSETFQDGAGHLTTTVDSYRITKRKLLIRWINNWLLSLPLQNDYFWTYSVDITVPTDSTSIDLPKYFIKVHTIKDIWGDHIVYENNQSNQNVRYFKTGKRSISRPCIGFTKGEVLSIYATFYPEKVIDDDNQELDCPDEAFEYLMKYLLVQHKNSVGTDSQITYAELKNLMNRFAQKSDVFSSTAIIHNEVTL